VSIESAYVNDRHDFLISKPLLPEIDCSRILRKSLLVIISQSEVERQLYEAYMHPSNDERKWRESVTNDLADVPRSRTALRGCKVGFSIDGFVHIPGNTT
jgi:hypothetical protein